MAATFTLEVVGQDLRLKLASTHTLFQLMTLICNEWLDEVRGGDGDVFAHMWTIRMKVGNRRREHVGPFEAFDDNQIEENDRQSTPLGELGLKLASTLSVEYDMGSTTAFKLKVVELGTDPAVVAAGPCVVTAPNSVPTDWSPHEPPAGTPTLDDCFPHLSRLAFGRDATWLLFFPLSKDCAAAIEAGPNAMGDLLYAPHAFSSAEECLLAADRAAAAMPDEYTRSDAFSRMVFPAAMGAKDERNYLRFVAEIDEFETAMRARAPPGGDSVMGFEPMMGIDEMARSGLSEKHMYMACGPKQVAVRLGSTELAAAIEELRGRGLNFSEAFPRCAEACASKAKKWISYRRGVLRLCVGDGMAAGERGVPAPGCEVAKLNRRFSTLQELFGAAEALGWDAGTSASAMTPAAAGGDDEEEDEEDDFGDDYDDDDDDDYGEGEEEEEEEEEEEASDDGFNQTFDQEIERHGGEAGYGVGEVRDFHVPTSGPRADADRMRVVWMVGLAVALAAVAAVLAKAEPLV